MVYTAIIYMDLHPLLPVICIFLPSGAIFVYIGLVYEISLSSPNLILQMKIYQISLHFAAKL